LWQILLQKSLFEAAGTRATDLKLIGAKAEDLCRRHGISGTTFYKWKAKFGGMEASDAKRLRALEDENRRLKKLLAEQMLDNAALKDLVGKNF
jgi:putative transposase